jgi:hypothetical protein
LITASNVPVDRRRVADLELHGQISGSALSLGDRVSVEVDAEPPCAGVTSQHAQQHLAGAATRIEDQRLRRQRQGCDGGVDSRLRHRVGERQADVGDPRGARQGEQPVRYPRCARPGAHAT